MTDKQHQIDERLPPWARRVILSGMCGSHVHGTFIPPAEQHGTDDEDVFQVICHPKTHYLGLAYYRRAREAYQTNGEALDICVHELVKFVYLCARGNPNVNTYLWLQPQEYFTVSAAGNVLLASREVFLSKQMFTSFSGYAYGQLKKMLAGVRLGYMGDKRKQLMTEYGYDIKNAAHCVRLFLTGIALAKTGRLEVKLTGHDLDMVTAIKRGLWDKDAVERYATDLDAEFRVAKTTSQLPDYPDADVVDRLLRRTLETHWETQQES